jgi:RNA polymerase sigma-70 factor (ECF subfamily)
MLPVEDDWKVRARDLLRAAQGGDDAARGQLLELYRSYLMSIAEGELTGNLRPKAGASDVVQDTLLEAHAFFARFIGDKGEEFRVWLRGILLNKLAQVHAHYNVVQKRHVGRERSLDESAPGGPLRDALPGDVSTPSGHVARDEESAWVRAAMARLPEDVRQVIHWRNWEGLPFAEIGRRLGRSEDAARMFFTRAVEALADELGGDRGERRSDGNR